MTIQSRPGVLTRNTRKSYLSKDVANLQNLGHGYLRAGRPELSIMSQELDDIGNKYSSLLTGFISQLSSANPTTHRLEIPFFPTTLNSAVSRCQTFEDDILYGAEI